MLRQPLEDIGWDWAKLPEVELLKVPDAGRTDLWVVMGHDEYAWFWMHTGLRSDPRSAHLAP